MNRRDMIKHASAAGIAMAAGTAFAKEEKHHHHTKVKDSGFSKSKLEKVAQKARDCVEAGEICIAHCMRELAQGNGMMAPCLAIVVNSVEVCNALAAMANYNTLAKQEFGSYVKACIGICELCAAECEKHKKHQECKDCHEACKECIEACESLIA